MFLNKRSKRYNMSKKAANDTLKNVLAACNIESDNINFDLLLIKSMAQTNYVDACKWIAIGVLFLVLISPLALINNDIKIESKNLLNNDRIIIVDHTLDEAGFTIELAGDDIDYGAIYAENADGRVPYNNEALTIHITDMHGHSLNAELSGTISR